MSERRMFARAIIGSGKFLMMPPTARLLYYDLGMEADDDGIVEAFRVMRTTGASSDDLKILAAKGFVRILNDDLVLFINDWKINNFIRGDRYHPSVYANLLSEDANGIPAVYQPDTNGIPQVSKTETEDRLGKDSIVQYNSTPSEAEEEPAVKSASVPFKEISEHYKKLCPSFPGIRSIEGARKTAVSARWRMNPDLNVFDTLFNKAEASDFLKGKNDRNWTANFDWMMNADHFSRILEGRYDNRIKPSGAETSFETASFFEAALARSYADYNQIGENAEK